MTNIYELATILTGMAVCLVGLALNHTLNEIKNAIEDYVYEDEEIAIADINVITDIEEE